MREIKFRAWDKDSQKMFTVENIDFKDRMLLNAVDLMQFTGLQDWKGQDIYEGDIIKFSPSHKSSLRGFIGYVFYSDAEAAFYHTCKKGRPSKRFFGLLDWRLEVIGNIHENPELMEDKPHERV